MIPVIIVPVLNRKELLLEMLASIDHPVGKVVIIDNGDIVGVNLGHIMPHRNVGEYRVIQPGHNLGVAASWNLGIKATPLADWWLICNSDIKFGPGDLAKWDAEVQPRAAMFYLMLGMAIWGLTPPTLQAVGFLDESIHPAYDEDLDWARRAELAGVPRQECGFSGTHVGSATIAADRHLWQQNGRTHMANDRYYAEKWGGQKQGGETFETPFDRKGHLGDWRLDINRLREQTWRK